MGNSFFESSSLLPVADTRSSRAEDSVRLRRFFLRWCASRFRERFPQPISSEGFLEGEGRPPVRNDDCCFVERVDRKKTQHPVDGTTQSMKPSGVARPDGRINQKEVQQSSPSTHVCALTMISPRPLFVASSPDGVQRAGPPGVCQVCWRGASKCPLRLLQHHAAGASATIRSCFRCPAHARF